VINNNIFNLNKQNIDNIINIRTFNQGIIKQVDKLDINKEKILDKIKADANLEQSREYAEYILGMISELTKVTSNIKNIDDAEKVLKQAQDIKHIISNLLKEDKLTDKIYNEFLKSLIQIQKIGKSFITQFGGVITKKGKIKKQTLKSKLKGVFKKKEYWAVGSLVGLGGMLDIPILTMIGAYSGDKLKANREAQEEEEKNREKKQEEIYKELDQLKNKPNSDNPIPTPTPRPNNDNITEPNNDNSSNDSIPTPRPNNDNITEPNNDNSSDNTNSRTPDENSIISSLNNNSNISNNVGNSESNEIQIASKEKLIDIDKKIEKLVEHNSKISEQLIKNARFNEETNNEETIKKRDKTQEKIANILSGGSKKVKKENKKSANNLDLKTAAAIAIFTFTASKLIKVGGILKDISDDKKNWKDSTEKTKSIGVSAKKMVEDRKTPKMSKKNLTNYENEQKKIEDEYKKGIAKTPIYFGKEAHLHKIEVEKTEKLGKLSERFRNGEFGVEAARDFIFNKGEWSKGVSRNENIRRMPKKLNTKKELVWKKALKKHKVGSKKFNEIFKIGPENYNPALENKGELPNKGAKVRPIKTPKNENKNLLSENKSKTDKETEGELPNKEAKVRPIKTPKNENAKSNTLTKRNKVPEINIPSPKSSNKTNVVSTSGKPWKTNGNVNTRGLNPAMKNNLIAMGNEYTQKTGRLMVMNSGYRDKKKTLQLNSQGKGAKFGRSLHNYGLAVDINTGDLNSMNNSGLLKKYGFHRPIKGETWHLEPSSIDRNAVKNSGIAGMKMYSGAFNNQSGGDNIVKLNQSNTSNESEGEPKVSDAIANNTNSSPITTAQSVSDNKIAEKNLETQKSIANSGNGSSNQINNVSNNNIVNSGDMGWTIDDLPFLSQVKTGIA